MSNKKKQCKFKTNRDWTGQRQKVQLEEKGTRTKAVMSEETRKQESQGLCPAEIQRKQEVQRLPFAFLQKQQLIKNCVCQKKLIGWMLILCTQPGQTYTDTIPTRLCVWMWFVISFLLQPEPANHFGDYCFFQHFLIISIACCQYFPPSSTHRPCLEFYKWMMCFCVCGLFPSQNCCQLFFLVHHLKCFGNTADLM